MQDRDDAPPQHCERQSALGAEPVDERPGEQLADGVGDEEDAGDGAVFRVAEAEFGFEQRRRDRQRLAIDVADRGHEREQYRDEPALLPPPGRVERCSQRGLVHRARVTRGPEPSQSAIARWPIRASASAGASALRRMGARALIERMNAALQSFPVLDRVTSLIHGEPVANRAGFDIPVVNPADERTISVLREADETEVNAAVESARRAFDSGPWPRMHVDERKDILYAIRDKLRAHANELAYLETLNAGLTVTQVRGHVQRLARNFEFFAEVASTAAGETYTQAKGYLTYVTREPKGVCAAIAPWNAPLALASMRVASCIAFGNTCVLKPSEYTPLSMRRMVEVFHEAGLPPGVVNLVNGRGAVTGNALVQHPGI